MNIQIPALPSSPPGPRLASPQGRAQESASSHKLLGKLGAWVSNNNTVEKLCPVFWGTPINKMLPGPMGSLYDVGLSLSC